MRGKKRPPLERAHAVGIALVDGVPAASKATGIPQSTIYEMMKEGTFPRNVRITPRLVRWRESVLTMKEAGVHAVVELGAGKVLGGLVKRIDRDLTAVSVGTPVELEALAKTL